MDCCQGKDTYETPTIGVSQETHIKSIKPKRIIGENEGWVTITKRRRGPDGWKRKERAANKLFGLD